MKFSVVIPCLNAADTIGAQLDALAVQRSLWPWEVVVADNGSTDGTAEVVARYSQRIPGLRIVDASQRRGRPYARNAGVRAAAGDALLFCDADDEVGTGWLTAMTAALADHPFVACRIDCRKLNEPWVWESRGDVQMNGLQRLPYPPHVPHAGAGTLGIHRDAFESVGGFDESLLAAEDTFLCLRVQLAGVPLHFVPDAVVHVRFRPSLGETFGQGRSYGWYSALMYKKCLNIGIPKTPDALRTGAQEWKWLLQELRAVNGKGARGRVMWKLGYRIGRLTASIRHRVVAL